MTTPSPVYHLALREVHAAAGAVFEQRGNWMLPGRYAAPGAEHEALRTSAAVFDRSHRSRLLVSGTDALDVLREVFAGHVEDLEEGRAMRTVTLDAGGHISDLALVARTSGISYMVSGESGRRFETYARMQQAVRADYDVRVDDRTETTCLLGLAGPTAGSIAREHLSDALPARLEALHCVAFEFHGFRALAIRTSDTGEDGFEFMLAPAVAQHLIETLTGAGVRLAGADALEVARVEACVPAFAPDLEPGLSPAEADLDVLLDVPGESGRTLAALLIEGDPAMVGSTISVEGVRAGELRSCVRSPALSATIGLGIIDARHAFPGRAVLVGDTPATVVAKPFYRRRPGPNG